MDQLCYLGFVFIMLSRHFIATLWSPVGKGLTSWPFVIFIVILLLSDLLSCDRCGT